MGVNISEIVPKKEIEIDSLKGKTVAIDAFNTLYQFLTTIRQSDGTPLMDKNNKVTSHLSGLFYRNINLLKEGIKPVYVFDGKPPELKQEEIEKRKKEKREARERFEGAKERKDKEGMRKYAAQTVSMTSDLIEESKELLRALGIPVVEAPGEGEAEAAYLARNRRVYAAASQDFDSLLYGTPFLIRNLTLARKRKSSSGIYVEVKPEMIELEEVLTKLNINLEQLICLAILVGTDYNPGGVKGLGQKRALEIVQRHEIPAEIFKAVKNNERYEIDFDWNQIFAHFYKYDSKKQEIEFTAHDPDKIREVLTRKDFSIDRVNSGIEKLEKFNENKKQKGLSEFFSI